MGTQEILVIISLMAGIGSAIYSFTRGVKKDSGTDSKWQGMMEQKVRTLEIKNREQDSRMDKIDTNIKEGFINVNKHIDSKMLELKEDWKEQIKQLIDAFKAK